MNETIVESDTEIKYYNSVDKPSSKEKKEIVEFLFESLEQYGDPRSQIERAIDFALKEIPSFGGFVLVARTNCQMSGIVVVNQTGMDGYIPENILVYIATNKTMRGKGIGKKLMNEAINLSNGDIALHVEPENPARYLYESLGFENKYLEMRLKKKG